MGNIMGKIIVIEGIDGSGKATQSKLLKYHLMKEKFPFYEIAFPAYKKESSYFVRQSNFLHISIISNTVILS